MSLGCMEICESSVVIVYFSVLHSASILSNPSLSPHAHIPYIHTHISIYANIHIFLYNLSEEGKRESGGRGDEVKLMKG